MDCLIAIIVMALFVGAVYMGVRRLPISNATPPKTTQEGVRVVNDALFIFPEWRKALMNLLRQIRNDKDPIAALENAMAFMEQGVWLPIREPLPYMGTEAQSEASLAPTSLPVPPPVAQVPEALPSPTATIPVSPPVPVAVPITPMVAATAIPMAVPAPQPMQPAPVAAPVQPVVEAEPLVTPKPAAPPAPPKAPLFTLPTLPSIEMPDNITLLLYLGAALVVIAAGVFVGGSWDAISGMARFALVLGFALGFGWTGELFVRFTDKLKNAGLTFRTVGTVLLPFAVLAYERFVLNGNATAEYWVFTGLGLAGVNYLLYQYSQKGRLTAYLAVFSLGVFALSLPNALKWGDGWFTPIMWLFAVGMFGIVWRLAPNGMTLLRSFLRRGNDPIAESHFVLALLMMATGFFFWGRVQGSWNEAMTWAALATVLVQLALYYRAGWVAGVAALVAGASALHLGAAIAPALAGAPTLSLLVLATGLMLIAPFSPKRLGHGNMILTGVALLWAVVARLFPGADYWEAIQGVAIIGYVGLPLIAAFRFRNFPLWSGVWLTVNIAVMDGLSLLPTPPQIKILVPVVLYAVVGGLWLVVEKYPFFDQLRTYARRFFVVQAACLTLFCIFIMLAAGAMPIVDIALAAAWGLGLLTLGWLWLTRRLQSEASAIATVVEGILALVAILYYVQLPNHWIGVVWGAVATLLLVFGGSLPTYARRVAQMFGLGVAAVAPWTGLLESFFFPTLDIPYAWSAYSAQGVLALSTGLYLWQAARHRSEALTYITTLFAYILAIWVSNDYLPAALFAPALLALGIGTLAVRRFAPAKAPQALELLGYSTVALAAFVGGSWMGVTRHWEPLWNLPFATWLQGTLLGAVIVYGIGTRRHQNVWLAYGTTGLLYILAPWVGADYLPIEFLPPLMLGLGVLILAWGWYAPKASKGLIEIIGYGTVLFSPLLGWCLVPFSSSTIQLEIGWLTLESAMQMTLLGATLLYIEAAVRERSAPFIYTATALVYLYVGWMSYDYLSPVLYAPILLGMGIATLMVTRYTNQVVADVLNLLGYLVVAAAPFVGADIARWVNGDSQWLTWTITQWAQLTLLGTTATYMVAAARRQSTLLTYCATAFSYLLMGWLSYDYLPSALFAPILLATGLVTLNVARFTPALTPRVLTLLGYGVVAASAFVGWFAAQWLDASSQWGGLNSTQWAQLTLAGSALAYGIYTHLRRSEVLAYITHALTYSLIAWVSYDYLPAALYAPVMLLAGWITLSVAPFTPLPSRRMLEWVGYGIVLAAPFLAPVVAMRVNPESLWLSLDIAIWGQITLAASAATFMIRSSLRRSEPLTYLATALTYILVGWLTYDHLPVTAYAPILLLTGLVTLAIARYTPAGAPLNLQLLGDVVVFVAPFAGWVWGTLTRDTSYWLTLPFITWVQATLGGTVLAYGVGAVRRQAALFTYLTTALSYLWIGWIALDYLPTSWQAFISLGLALLTLALAPMVPVAARNPMRWTGYTMVLLAPFAEFIFGDFARLGSMAGLMMRGQLTMLLSATVYAGLGWYRKERNLVAIGAVLLYGFYAWVAFDQGVTELQMYTVPLAILLYAFGLLFRSHRLLWEIASLLVLLPPAALQTLGEVEQLRYSLMLGLWGLILLIAGIVQERRMMVVGGGIALLFAALRQLWAVVSTLPIAAVIGVAGLLLIAVAVGLTLTRERWMRRVEG